MYAVDPAFCAANGSDTTRRQFGSRRANPSGSSSGAWVVTTVTWWRADRCDNVSRLRIRPPEVAGQSPPILIHRSRIAGRGGAHHVGRRLSVDECSQPDFEIDQQPETVGVPRPSTAMLVHKLLKPRAIEVPSRRCARPEHELVDEWAEFAADPLVGGASKPHLWAFHDFGRDEISDGVAQDRFRPPSTQLHATGHADNMLDQPVVQKRHAAFDRRRHAHLILFHQQL